MGNSEFSLGNNTDRARRTIDANDVNDRRSRAKVFRFYRRITKRSNPGPALEICEKFSFKLCIIGIPIQGEREISREANFARAVSQFFLLSLDTDAIRE